MYRWPGTSSRTSITLSAKCCDTRKCSNVSRPAARPIFTLRVVVEDIDAYNAFLDDFVFNLPGVSQVRSNIVLKEIKADTALPFR